MHLRIDGIPAAQGSKKALPVYKGTGDSREFTGRVNVVEDSPAVGPWRKQIAAACAAWIAHQRHARGLHSLEGVPLYGPGVAVQLQLLFYLPRPAHHWGTGRNTGTVKPGAPDYPTGRRHDIDKIERAILDALTMGGLWHDDGQASAVLKSRDYAGYGERPGVEIWARRRAPIARMKLTSLADRLPNREEAQQ